MSQDITAFATSDLLAFGEPAHWQPAHARLRNDLFAQLVDRGFRSIALETDRVAALAVNDFVQEGIGTLDAVMKEGFTHNFGDFDANRELVAWMRSHNENRPADQRVAFHGFDGPMEMMNAPSPRRFLEHARDYLGLDVDIAGLAGDDELWWRTEAVMDPDVSLGDSAEADRLRVIADDMLTKLYARAPERIAATSRAEWQRAKTHLSAGIGMLRYHKQAAEQIEDRVRWSLLSAVRDAIMAENLLDIRDIEAGRGTTLVFAHNRHLQRGTSTLELGPMHIDWFSAGAIVSALVGERYTFIAGSLGSSETLGIGEPEADTYEGDLQSRIPTWGLTTELPSGRTRTGIDPMTGYIPLDAETLDRADAVLHISGR
ncbi:erythromycin esterase [Lentzea sp. NBRC 105346]|uniref:erythromycin esterase family protein n=1 Tax=Lentzea sp. NBRC 105346 TaxID=3032205 RepID=UPI0024A116FA|nr:erythromycin esterase family protein [Lentzea sp. NBRC 105346]GLZ33646.1 erythromycin esterase [Lentzea sp. NBRC 105346]